MTEQDVSDKEVSSLLERQRRARKIIKIAVLVTCIPLGAWSGALTWRFVHGPPPHIELMSFGTLLVAMIAGTVLLIHRLRPPAAAYTPGVLAKLADKMQHDRARAFMLFPVSALLSTPAVLNATFNLIEQPVPPVAWLYLAVALGFSIITVVNLLMLTGRGFLKVTQAVYNDELSRAHRAEALQVGFWTVMVGGTALYLVGLYRPAWAVAGLPVILMYAVAISTLWFAVLERRADRDE